MKTIQKTIFYLERNQKIVFFRKKTGEKFWMIWPDPPSGGSPPPLGGGSEFWARPLGTVQILRYQRFSIFRGRPSPPSSLRHHFRKSHRPPRRRHHLQHKHPIV